MFRRIGLRPHKCVLRVKIKKKKLFEESSFLNLQNEKINIKKKKKKQDRLSVETRNDVSTQHSYFSFSTKQVYKSRKVHREKTRHEISRNRYQITAVDKAQTHHIFAQTRESLCLIPDALNREKKKRENASLPIVVFLFC